MERRDWGETIGREGGSGWGEELEMCGDFIGRLGGEGDEKRGVSAGALPWTPCSLQLSLLFPETTNGLFTPCPLFIVLLAFVVV